jgi:predicted metal-dependent peptidase
MTADEKIHIAILKILSKTRLKLFGCLIYKFDIIIVDNGRVPTACCSIDQLKGKPVIEFSRPFVDTLQNVEQTIYVILHEMIHFIDGHLHKCRTEHKDQTIFGLAADHIVNTMLNKDAKSELIGIIEPPKNLFIVKELCDKEYSLMEVYEYLMNIYQSIRIVIQDNNKSQTQQDQQGQQNPGQGDTSQNIGSYADVYINEEYQGSVPLDLNSKSVSSNASKATSDELTSEIRAIINTILNKQQQKGNIVGSVYEYLKKISKLEVPWDILLENAIQTSRVKSNTNRTWKNLRKKFRHLGIKLPDTSKEEIKDNLYILLDTSGSMRTTEQSKFISLILQSINYFKRVKIIQHDFVVQNVLELTHDNFETEKENVFKIYGRGGTSHKDCFKYIEKVFFEEDEAIGLIILATDYESDIELIWNKFEFHKYIPIKVLCTKQNKISSDVDTNPIFC